MSEAETSSTTRKRGGLAGSGAGSASGGRHSIPMGALQLNRQGFAPGGQAAAVAGQQQLQQPRRGVSLRQPVVQFSGVSSTLFEDDPGIMSEVETVSTSGRRRQQQQQQKLAEKHALPVVRTPSKTLERPLGAQLYQPHFVTMYQRDRVCQRLLP